MPVLSLVLFRLYRARGGLRKQLALCGVLWQTSTACIYAWIVLIGNDREWIRKPQAAYTAYILFTIPLVHSWLLLWTVLGLGGRAEPYSYSKLTCVPQSTPEVKRKVQKKQAREGVGLVYIRIRRTKRSKSGYNRVRSELEPVVNEWECPWVEEMT